MFEKAVRMKLRFESPRGLLSVEDLWDMPLTGTFSLNNLAISLQSGPVSFVEPVVDTERELRFELVKHVIATRIRERDERSAASDRALKKKQLLEVLSRKQNAELESKTPAELLAMIEAL